MSKIDKINFIDYISCALRADAELRKYEKATKDILEKSIDENFIVHESRVLSALSPNAIFYSLSYLLLNDWPSDSVLDHLEDTIMSILCEFSIFEFKISAMVKLQQNIEEYSMNKIETEALVYQSNIQDKFHQKMKNKANADPDSTSLSEFKLSDEVGYEWIEKVNNLIVWTQLISGIEEETSVLTPLLKMKNSGNFDKLE